MLPNGSQRAAAHLDLAQNSSPAWSPDGSQIAFLAVPPDGGQNEVYVVNADGSDLEQVSTGDIPHALPSPTPPTNRQSIQPLSSLWPAALVAGQQTTGGAAVVFSHQFLPGAALSQRWSGALPGGGQRRSQSGRLGAGWTNSVAFIAQDGQALWVWNPALAQVDGTNPNRLYYDGSWDMAYGLTWSPDSSQIALIVGKRDTNDNFTLDLRIFPSFWGATDTAVSLWSGSGWQRARLPRQRPGLVAGWPYLAYCRFSMGRRVTATSSS